MKVLVGARKDDFLFVNLKRGTCLRSGAELLPATFIVFEIKIVPSNDDGRLNLGLSGDKPLREGGLKSVGIYVFVLLLGFVFGYVLQSAGSLVRAVDSFSRSGSNAEFTAYR